MHTLKSDLILFSAGTITTIGVLGVDLSAIGSYVRMLLG